jgi:hypothetical protein
MKYVRKIGWMVSLTLLGLGCSKKEPEPEFDFRPCDCGKPTLETVVNQTGEIEFHDEMGVYAINRHIPNTIDSKEIYFLCRVPEAFQEEGLVVRFSGEAKAPCKMPNDLTGAQQFYDIRLTKLEKE